MLIKLNKTVERMVRAVCKNLEITDLPTGPREMWVNRITSKLYKIMHAGDPIPDLESFILHELMPKYHSMQNWMYRINKIEEGMRPKK